MTQTHLSDHPPFCSSDNLSKHAFTQSETIIPPLIHHLVNTNTLYYWCLYSVDLSLVTNFSWSKPDPKCLYWLYSLKDDDALARWSAENNNNIALDWHISLSCACFSAAQALFADHLDELYIKSKSDFEFVECHILDFGHNKGLAEEAYLLALDNDNDLSSLPIDANRYQSKTERIYRGDQSHPFSQIISTLSLGDLLPPLRYSDLWLLVKAVNIVNPKRSELQESLLLRSFLEWRSQTSNSLFDHWRSFYINS